MRVAIEHVSHHFAHRGKRLQALDDVNLVVQPGEFVAILGPSGCGKSTLLRLIANLLQPSQGTVLLDGRPPAQVVKDKRVAWMSQQVALLPWYTVRANVALAQRVNPRNHRSLASPDDLLAMVELAPFADMYPAALSGGMQQRTALARALALGADLWLMDEPFAALDELTRERLGIDLLRYRQVQHPTILWVTHHLREAVQLADRVFVMTPRPGRLLTEIAVPLPHPRDDTADEIQILVRRLRAALV